MLYRILLAFLTAFQSFANCALSWLPMYGEAKLALVVYLWHPKTMASHHPRPHPAEQDVFFFLARTYIAVPCGPVCAVCGQV